MNLSLPLAMLAVLPPFAGFVISGLFLQRRPRAAAGFVVACGVASFIGALGLAFGGTTEESVWRAAWLVSGEWRLEFGFLLDGTSRLVGLVVAGITLAVQIYSLGYMAHDPGKPRFFALLGLFAWSMLTFVYSVNLLQTFIFWELVGLTSFFLIGFWFEKPSAARAARKAFIMTRVGDIGLFIGLILLLGELKTSDLPQILHADFGAIARSIEPGRLTLIVLLIFLGIMGKSAQFPLHTWLPDAMEGPTPVSALLHSATMVAAGVYLLARLHPLLILSPTAMTVILVIATITVILASTMAMVEPDIKRVLAYSTVSQLGYMLLALAAGGLFAGLFHLTTHAVFKALLFLCAGAYIHHHDTNELVEIGRRGGRRMRKTTLGLIIGGGALAGVPPLAGFFSKESVLTQLHHHAPPIFYIAALFGAFLTAYYTFRMIFLVVLPDRDEAHEGASHAHGDADGPTVMWGPIAALTLLSVVLGFSGGWIAGRTGTEVPHASFGWIALALAVVAFGVGGAWLDFGRRGALRAGFVSRFPALQTLFRNKWYIDSFYNRVVALAVGVVAIVCQMFEQDGLDRVFDKSGEGVIRSGRRTARTQSGWLQLYIGSTVLLLTILVLYIGLH